MKGSQNSLVNTKTIETLFRQAGIIKSKPVIIYDSGEMFKASRMFWMLEYTGHQKVAVLNGGMNKWKASNFKTETKRYLWKPSLFSVQLQPDKYASRRYVKIAIKNPKIKILDARSKEEWLGESETSAYKGRIPGAINIPFTAFFNQSKGFKEVKTKDQTAKLLGPFKDAKTLLYCNSGRKSTLVYMVMRQHNLDVVHYGGSWIDWSQDKSLPIEKGQAN